MFANRLKGDCRCTGAACCATTKPKSPNKECRAEDRRCKCSLKPEGDILRFFLARGDLRALLPIVAELADQIERAGDENGVFRRGLGERAFEGALGVRDYGKTRGMMAGNFRELRGGNGARNARRGEDDLCGMREKKPSYFVDGFIAKGGVDQPDFAAREVLFEEMGEFAGGAGIVRTIEVNGRVGLQFF